ncbi:MlaD family protein [Flavobacterium sp. N2820]|uniref:MlaD family protein n=1 Tax=Flavobacterium sp. N2820 TaxID=2986834 RepID=UPI0022257743|nr:MlaD family protein [Flavobacterium sp. N2820]
MEKTDAQKIRLGLFVIIGSLFFLAAIYFVGNKQNMFGNTSNLKAVFVNVSGLQVGNNVRYAGIDIGTVKSIEMINDTTINVAMSIEDKMLTHIKKDAIATIGSDGLVGNMIVNIIPGKGNAQAVVAGDVLQSYSRASTDEMLKTLDVTNKNAALLTADLLKITNEINQGKGTVGVLLKDSLMSKDLKETMHGTAESVANLNKMILSLNQEDNVIGLLKDNDVALKMKNIITNLEKSSGEIDKVVTNLNATVVNIKDGKGALNYLSNDENLVKKIDSTMTNLNDASTKLNENLEALKHNFLFRGYFRKQAKEKAKEEKN